MEEAKKISGEAATVLKPWLEEMEARLDKKRKEKEEFEERLEELRQEREMYLERFIEGNSSLKKYQSAELSIAQFISGINIKI